MAPSSDFLRTGFSSTCLNNRNSRGPGGSRRSNRRGSLAEPGQVDELRQGGGVQFHLVVSRAQVIEAEGSIRLRRGIARRSATQEVDYQVFQSLRVRRIEDVSANFTQPHHFKIDPADFAGADDDRLRRVRSGLEIGGKLHQFESDFMRSLGNSFQAKRPRNVGQYRPRAVDRYRDVGNRALAVAQRLVDFSADDSGDGNSLRRETVQTFRRQLFTPMDRPAHPHKQVPLSSIRRTL